MMTPRYLPLIFCLLMFSPGAAMATHGDPIMGRVLAQPCGSCHGLRGENKIEGIPNLAGQQFNYIVKQLHEMQASAKLRSGDKTYGGSPYQAFMRTRRTNEIMDQQVIGLSDHDIADIAAFYANLQCHANKRDPQLAPPKIEVRCRVCHGNLGIANTPNVPNIAGQDVSYLQQQLKSFQGGKTLEGDGQEKRRAAIMEGQVKNLTDEDIKEVAVYYSRLPCRN